MPDLPGLDAAETLTRMLHAIDVLDWATVRECLADEVTADYTDLRGGEPATVAAADLIDQWRALLPGFVATQHLTGTTVIDRQGDGYTVATHVRAYHHLPGVPGGETWGVHGSYRAGIVRVGEGWRINALTLQVFFIDGNPSLPQVATGRAKRQPRIPGTRLPPRTDSSAGSPPS